MLTLRGGAFAAIWPRDAGTCTFGGSDTIPALPPETTRNDRAAPS
jgi:hypothetical protein